MPGEYSIGSYKWNGLSKLIEECGEVTQVAGKLLGNNGKLDHWDGSNLRQRMEEELGDLQAAILFFRNRNGLDGKHIAQRMELKYNLFNKWNEEQKEKS